MKKLLRYLSPFAPDQSGVCGVLYELGGLIVICDAGGCAGNICGFDEPRWFTKKSAVFSAGLRDMDAIMGRDDKLIAKLADAEEMLGCRFTALIATPVPAVIGTDMKALKRMAENKTGVPCISINAIGTRYFDEGESDAWLELMKEFAGKSDGQEKKLASKSDEQKKELAGKSGEQEKMSAGSGTEAVEGKSSGTEAAEGKSSGTEAAEGKSSGTEAAEGKSRIGIIGATPLETGYSSPEPLLEGCRKYNIPNPVIYGVGTGLEEIMSADKVSKNIVVSAAGIKAAKYLEEQFGISYEVGYPFIPEQVLENVKAYLDEEVLPAETSGETQVREDDAAQEDAITQEDATAQENTTEQENVIEQGNVIEQENVIEQGNVTVQKKNLADRQLRILIIHSQFAANELRNIIRSRAGAENHVREVEESRENHGLEAEKLRVDVATFFMMDDDYKEAGDFRLSGEDELWDIASENKYDAIIADEDVERLLKAAGFKGRFIAFPQFAISGRPLDEGKTLYDYKS